MTTREFEFCPVCAAKLVDHKACPREGCGFVHYGNPTPVVAAIVEWRGNVVLVRNLGWPEGMFGLVTGFLEAGEEPSAGAQREVKEELGLDTELVSLVGTYAFVPRNEVILAFHLRAKDEAEIVKGDELAAFKPVPIGKLRPWPFATGLAVKDWLAARRT